MQKAIVQTIFMIVRLSDNTDQREKKHEFGKHITKAEPYIPKLNMKIEKRKKERDGIQMGKYLILVA